MSDAGYALGVQKLFTLFFVMLGPLKLLGPFARATEMLTAAELRAIAVRITLIATLTAIAGGFLGRALLESWGIPIFALRLTGGLILFMVALQLVLLPYQAPAPSPAPGTAAERPNAMKLVFPMVLTPHGIAAVIVLLAISHGAERTEVIIAVLLAVMLLNLLAMAFIRPVLKVVAPVLWAIGSVLALLQMAVSVQIILTALHGLGVLGGPA